MTQHSPFDSRRDPVIGRVLRDALEPRDNDAFVARVLAGVPAGGTWWEVLGAWARPGLAAALLLAALGGFWLGRAVQRTQAPFALEEILGDSAGNGTMSALMAPTPPDVEMLFAGAGPD